MHSKKKNIFQTCKLESCVKAFSQPGWVHLYGRSPVWILNYEHSHRHHTFTGMDSADVKRCWNLKAVRHCSRGESTRPLTCCAAEGGWAVWNSCDKSRMCTVWPQCGCGCAEPGSLSLRTTLYSEDIYGALIPCDSWWGLETKNKIDIPQV